MSCGSRSDWLLSRSLPPRCGSPRLSAKCSPGSRPRTDKQQRCLKQATATDDTCAARVGSPGSVSSRRLTLYSLGTRATFKGRFFCPKIKRLLTNQLKVGLAGFNTNVVTTIASHTKTDISFRPVEAQDEHRYKKVTTRHERR